MSATPDRPEAGALHAELERRLRTLEDPGYEDPAHRDLPRTDLLWLAAAVVLVVVVAYAWGY